MRRRRNGHRQPAEGRAALSKRAKETQAAYPGGWAQVVTQERVSKRGLALGKKSGVTPKEAFEEEMNRLKAREAWARRPDTKF